MNKIIGLSCATAIITMPLVAAMPAAAQINRAEQKRPHPNRAPATSRPERVTPQSRPAPTRASPPAPIMPPVRPATGVNRPDNRPHAGGNVNIGNTTNVVVGGNRRPTTGYYGTNYYPGGYRPPVYRPGGAFYVAPPAPIGGWRGGYYPPTRYFYDPGPSFGQVVAGVAVVGGLIAILTAASKPSAAQQQVTTVQTYHQPAGSDGRPAMINVELGMLEASARPAASICITETSRQIGATGGSEIRIDRMIDVEKGNGGYRFRLILIGVYPDADRKIPTYCRATSEKIIELSFG
jgi:hypothetical protein